MHKLHNASEIDLENLSQMGLNNNLSELNDLIINGVECKNFNKVIEPLSVFIK